MVGMMKKLLVALMTISLLMSMLCVSAMAKEEKKNDKNEHKKDDIVSVEDVTEENEGTEEDGANESEDEDGEEEGAAEDKKNKDKKNEDKKSEDKKNDDKNNENNKDNDKKDNNNHNDDFKIHVNDIDGLMKELGVEGAGSITLTTSDGRTFTLDYKGSGSNLTSGNDLANKENLGAITLSYGDKQIDLTLTTHGKGNTEDSTTGQDQGLSQILCKHRNAVQIEQNLFKAEVAQAAAALFSK